MLQILKIHYQHHLINLQFFEFPVLYVVKIKQLFVKIQKLFLLTLQGWKKLLLLHFFQAFQWNKFVALSQGFLIQLVCLSLLQFICNVLKSTHNLINCLLCNHFNNLFVCCFAIFYWHVKETFLSINTLKSFIWTFGT